MKRTQPLAAARDAFRETITSAILDAMDAGLSIDDCQVVFGNAYGLVRATVGRGTDESARVDG